MRHKKVHGAHLTAQALLVKVALELQELILQSLRGFILGREVWGM